MVMTVPSLRVVRSILEAQVSIRVPSPGPQDRQDVSRVDGGQCAGTWLKSRKQQVTLVYVI